MAKTKTQRGAAVARPAEQLHLKFRTRWRHVLLIDERIRSDQAPNCAALARELEVCRRTILRDIDFLRDDLGAPVEYDQARNGYVYTETNWVMPSVRVTEGELFAVLVAEKALAAYAGTPWAENLRKVFDRMLGSLPDRIEVRPAALLDRVEFDAQAPSPVDPGILTTLSKAVTANKAVRLAYRPLGQAKPREYTVDPYVLRRARGAWYLAGRDRQSGYVPLFNLSRVQSAELTGATFDYATSGFDPATYFGATFGVYEAAKRHKVVIEFSGIAVALIRERHWHSSQKLSELAGGRLRLELTVSHLDDIRPWILSWGSEARVLGPPALVTAVATEVARMSAAYRGECKKRGDS